MDISLVSEEPPLNKGYGNSTTIAFDVDQENAAKIILLSLAETVCTRLRADSAFAYVVAVSIVNSDFRHASHQMTLFSATNTTVEIHRAACRLFDELWDGTPIRKLGIHTGRLVHGAADRQLNLLDMDRFEKYSRMDAMVDTIRGRFGEDSIKRAVFIDSPIYHMAGGIAPEKRRPDYGTGIRE